MSLRRRSVLAFAVILGLAVGTVWRAFAGESDAGIDTLSVWRTRLAASGEADLERTVTQGIDPVERAAHAVMLAERLARRDVRAESPRIADLLAQADRWLEKTPTERVEAALFGARLLGLDARHAEAATARLRDALRATEVRRPVRSRAEFGLAFLTADPDESLQFCTRVVEQDRDGAYAPLAAQEGIRFALARDAGSVAVSLALQLQSMKAATSQDRMDGLSRLARETLARFGYADYRRRLPGTAPDVGENPVPEPSAGMLLAVPPGAPPDPRDPEQPSGAELAAPVLIKHWTREVPQDLFAGCAPGRYIIVAGTESDVELRLTDLTALGLEARVGPDEIVVRACDSRDGSPAEGAVVKGVLGVGGNTPPWEFEGVTDAAGLLRLAAPVAAREDHGSELQVTAAHPLGKAWLDDSGLSASSERDGWRILVYASKPVARPGEEVAFRLAARQRDRAGEPPVPAGAGFHVVIEHVNGTTIQETTLRLSEFGTAGGTIRIPERMNGGWVQARILPAEGTRPIRHPVRSVWWDPADGFVVRLFRVEEYRLPDVLLDVETDQPAYVGPTTVTVTVRARGAEGGPVAGFSGRLHLSADSEPWWFEADLNPLPFLSAVESEDDRENAGWTEPLVPEMEGLLEFTTDSEGRASVRLPLPGSEWDPVQRVSVYAEGQDAQGRMAAGSATFRLAREAGRVRLAVDYDWKGSGVVRGRAVVEDLEGKRRAVPVIVELHGPGMEAMRRNLAGGEAGFEFAGLATGTYSVTARAEVDGRTVRGEEWAWVWHPGGPAGGRLHASSITLQAERVVYRPGEILTVDAILPEGTSAAFASLEGTEILDVRVTREEGGRVRFAFPLPIEAAPNVRLVVSAWNGGRRSEAMIERYIDTGSLNLQVDVKADPPEAKPGEEVAWTVRVRDASGNPVDAEVSLGVVDERIYRIEEDPARSVASTFAPLPKPYLVWGTHNGFDDEEAGQSRSAGAVSAAFAMEDGGGGTPSRRDFRDLVGWHDALRTGPDGETTVRVAFSDSLTPWRATARAFAASGGAGEGRGEAQTTLPISVRLDLPRLMREGDRVQVSAVVRNLTAGPLEGTVSLRVDGLECSDPGDRPIRIGPREVGVAAWTVSAASAPQATLTAAARLGGFVDAVERRLDILPARVRVPIFARAMTGPNGQAQLSLGTVRDPDRATLELLAASEEVERLLEPVDRLLHYPYGCVEQTMSSFLPAVLVQAAMKRLGAAVPALEAKLPGVTQAGLRRLMRFQHEDGGWGWWTDDETDPFMTGYVLHGLLLGQEHGLPVDADRLARGLDWAAEWVDREDEPALHYYLRAALALAKRESHADREGIDPGDAPTALCWAAREAATRDHGERVRELLARLARSATRDADGSAHWAEHGRFWGLGGVATALAVETLVLLEGPGELPAAGLRALDRARAAPHGLTTIGNAYAAAAAAAFLQARGVQSGPVSAALTRNGLPVPPRSDQGTRNLAWTLSGREALSGPLNLELHGPSDHPVRLVVRGEDFYSSTDLPPASDEVRLVRDLLQLIDPDHPEEASSWRSVRPEEPVRIGGRYAIRYTLIRPEGIEFFALADPRPAGMEPVSPRSGNVQTESAGDAYLEVGARELAVFQKRAPADFSLRIPVRFDVPGTVHWPPARAWAMYDESVQAFCTARTLVILPPHPPPGRANLDRFRMLREAPEKDFSALTEEAATWRRLPDDLSEEERARMRELALSCRRGHAVWGAVETSVLAGVYRVSRPDRDDDVRFLLELAGPDLEEWPEALRSPGVWAPFQDRLVRLACVEALPGAWDALMVLADTMPSLDPLLDAFDTVPTAVIEKSVGAFVRWCAARRESEVFRWHRVASSEWRPTVSSPRTDERLRRILELWLQQPADRIAAEPELLWSICAWGERTAASGTGLASDPAWSSFKQSIVDATLRIPLDRISVPNSPLPLQGALLDAWAPRAVSANEPGVWAFCFDPLSAGTASPAPFLRALDSLPPDRRTPASDAFVSHWFAHSPPGSFHGEGTAAQRSELRSRFADATADWLERQEGISSILLRTWAWLEGCVDAATGSSGPEEFAPILRSVRARVTRYRPSDPDALDALAECERDLAGVAGVQAWVTPEVAAVADRIPHLALDCLTAHTAGGSPRELRRIVAGLPAGARRALGHLLLDRDSANRRSGWLEFFLRDSDPAIRESALQFVVDHPNPRFDDWLRDHPNLVVDRIQPTGEGPIRRAAELDLPEAIPVLLKIWRLHPDRLLAHCHSLAQLRCPAARDLLHAILARLPNSKNEEAIGMLEEAAAACEPPGTETELLARLRRCCSQTDSRTLESRMHELLALGRWTDVGVLLPVIRNLAESAGTNPASDEASWFPVLVRGAALRQDPTLREAYRNALSSTGALQSAAVLGLALDRSPEARALLFPWLASASGRSFLDTVISTPAPSDRTESHHPVWSALWRTPLEAEWFEVRGPRTVTWVLDALAGWGSMLPVEDLARLLDTLDPGRHSALIGRWLAAHAEEEDPRFLARAAEIASRVLDRTVSDFDSGVVALKVLGQASPGAFHAALEKASDRAWTACAGRVVGEGEPADLARLGRIARGSDPLLADHASWMLAWGGYGHRIVPGLHPPLLGLVGPDAPVNPFAANVPAGVRKALQATFGEDPFAAARGN